MSRVILVIWLLFLACLSMAPFDVKLHLKTMGHLHNVGHVLAFMITALLFAWGKPFAKRAGLCAAALLPAFGTEWVEYAIYHSRYEWSDVLLDVVGILLAFLILTVRPYITAGSTPSQAAGN